MTHSTIDRFTQRFTAPPIPILTAMSAEGKSSPKPHARKRSLDEPGEPWAKRRAGNAAVAPENAAAVSNPPRPRPGTGTAAKRVSRRLDDGPPDAIASSSASDVRSSAADPTKPTPSATAGAVVHVCGHCQKLFRSPGKLVQHERVLHAIETVPFCCSFCPKQFDNQGAATQHERTHTGAKPHACSMCPRMFAQKSSVAKHERTHTGEKPYTCSTCPRRFSEKNKVAPHERTHTHTLAPCARAASPTRAPLHRTSARTPARSPTLAPCAQGASARRATFPSTSGPTPRTEIGSVNSSHRSSMHDVYTFEERYADDDVFIEDADSSLSVL